MRGLRNSRCVGLLLVSACHCYRYPTEVAGSPDAAVPPEAASLVPSVAAAGTLRCGGHFHRCPGRDASSHCERRPGLRDEPGPDDSVGEHDSDDEHEPPPCRRGAFAMLPALCPNSIIPHSNRTAEALAGTRTGRSSLALPRAPSASSRAKRGTYRSVDTSASGTTRSGFGTTASTRTMTTSSWRGRWSPTTDTFWGGRCEPLCGTKTCASTQSASVQEEHVVSERLGGQRTAWRRSASTTARTTC